MSNLSVHKWLTGIIIIGYFIIINTLVMRLFLYKFVLKNTQRSVLTKTITRC